ncbi:MAG: hypothetical protein OEM62_08945, partial [Acidobacteriota bacterium]|nr:hypothetical protein [Acidobacteriota bacterium]
MKTEWDAEGKRIRLLFADGESLADFHRAVVEQNGLMVSLPVELALYSKAAVELIHDGMTLLDFEAEVAQAFEVPDSSWNTAFLTQDVPSLPEAHDDDTEAEDETETRGTAPVFRIQQMNPN